MFGPHLIMDCKSNHRLDDVHFIFDFLNNFPSQLGMQKLSAPYVIPYDGGNDPFSSGITGIVIIAESHISIHTFPKKGYFFIDIFSCKDFDSDKVKAIIKKEFQVEECNQWMINRGVDFPR